MLELEANVSYSLIEEEVLQVLNLSIAEVKENITTRGVSLGKIGRGRGYK